eukprot:2951696-Pleurochrysis_carterae.AAC.1
MSSGLKCYATCKPPLLGMRQRADTPEQPTVLAGLEANVQIQAQTHTDRACISACTPSRKYAVANACVWTRVQSPTHALAHRPTRTGTDQRTLTLDVHVCG